MPDSSVIKMQFLTFGNTIEFQMFDSRPAIKMKFFSKNICTVRKKAVILHPQSGNRGAQQ